MILNCIFIGIIFIYVEYIIYYVFDIIEICKIFMNLMLIFFGCGFYIKWKVELVKVIEGCVEGCKI